MKDNYIDELREELLGGPLELARLGVTDKTPDTPVAFAGWGAWEQLHTVALVQELEKYITYYTNKALKAELNQLLQQKQTYVVEVSSVQDLFADDLEVKREIAVPTTVIKTRLNQLEKE